MTTRIVYWRTWVFCLGHIRGHQWVKGVYLCLLLSTGETHLECVTSTKVSFLAPQYKRDPERLQSPGEGPETCGCSTWKKIGSEEFYQCTWILEGRVYRRQRRTPSDIPWQNQRQWAQAVTWEALPEHPFFTMRVTDHCQKPCTKQCGGRDRNYSSFSSRGVLCDRIISLLVDFTSCLSNAIFFSIKWDQHAKINRGLNLDYTDLISNQAEPWKVGAWILPLATVLPAVNDEQFTSNNEMFERLLYFLFWASLLWSAVLAYIIFSR